MKALESASTWIVRLLVVVIAQSTGEQHQVAARLMVHELSLGIGADRAGSLALDVPTTECTHAGRRLGPCLDFANGFAHVLRLIAEACAIADLPPVRD